MTPDEKRKECGQELVDKYFNPKVAAAFKDLCHCLCFSTFFKKTFLLHVPAV